MREVIAAVHSLTQTTQEVLAASRRQQRESDQVATTVGDLDDMTRENSVLVQKAEQASADVRPNRPLATTGKLLARRQAG